MVSLCLEIFLAKWNVKKTVFILQFNFFLGDENHTHKTGEGWILCAHLTLLTLTWASGRVGEC